MAADAGALHVVDVGILDAGHAWKTNPADLKATLHRQGFKPVELHLRKPGGNWRSVITRKLGCGLYVCSFGLGRSVLKALFPRSASDQLIRWFLAAERRCWFGANRLKNRYATEVLVEAQVL